MKNEMKRVRKEGDLYKLTVLSRNLSGETEENHEKFLLEWLVSGPRYVPRTTE